MKKIMDSKDRKKEVPKGRVVPVYLTEDGVIYGIRFHSIGELDILQSLVAGVLDGKIFVDTSAPLSNPDEKISIIDMTKKN